MYSSLKINYNLLMKTQIIQNEIEFKSNVPSSTITMHIFKFFFKKTIILSVFEND
jgi:hypothetical protein